MAVSYRLTGAEASQWLSGPLRSPDESVGRVSGNEYMSAHCTAHWPIFPGVLVYVNIVSLLTYLLAVV